MERNLSDCATPRNDETEPQPNRWRYIFGGVVHVVDDDAQKQ
jgi:hypothetical protein